MTRLHRFLVLWIVVAGCDSQPPPKKSASAAPPASHVLRESEPEATASPGFVQPTGDSTVEPDDEPPVAPEPTIRFRPPDRRPNHDDAALAAAGIHVYESPRLKLYTDIDPDIARTLPPVADQLHAALVAYFGPLPPDEQGTEFQATGYLIRDEAPYREHGLLEGLPVLHHGKHLANRFWMREQQTAYFRRHLLLHEWTHCFMTFVPGRLPPVWYMEGMAELFATHRLHDDGRAEFRILPTAADDTAGWGRIAAIRRLSAHRQSLSLGQVVKLPAESFFKPEAYAWSWALCKFFDAHPRYAERFHDLGRHLHDGEFEQRFRDAFSSEERNISTEWTLFEYQLMPGYDVNAAAIEFQAEKPLEVGMELKRSIQAERGWQDVGLRVAAGEIVEVSASGRFTLAEDPKPWISEPQGISIDYFNGMPLGRLVACFDADPSAQSETDDALHLLHLIPVGKSARLTAPAAGRLLLRLNDAWDSLDDNSGSAEVVLRRIE